jgi:xanthine dehydrogenase accessory factor
VLDALGLDGEERARVRTPAGLDIGAQSPGEVAVSIVAEVIALAAAVRTPQTHATDQTHLIAPSPSPAEATDPVCGMSVAVTEAAIRLEAQDGVVYFCCPNCRDAFAADPERYTRSL